jgi:hypothetical protein
MENPFSSATNTSSTRIAMFMCILAGIGIGIAALALNRNLLEAAALVTAFIAPAFAAKYGQSVVEGKAGVLPPFERPEEPKQ